MKKTLILPDLHAGSHDPRALGLAIDAAKVWRPDEVVILGDWLDASAYSSHARRSVRDAPGDYQAEIKIVRDALRRLRGRSETRRIIYIEGNHEHRVEARFVAGKISQEEYERAYPYAQLVDLCDVWVDYTAPRAHYAIAPDLIAIHGWYTGPNAPKQTLDRAGGPSVVYGHAHKLQQHAQVSVTGTGRLAWCPGCLCDLTPSYVGSRPTAWTHGLSFVYVRDGGSWNSYTTTLHNGLTLPTGRMLDG